MPTKEPVKLMEIIEFKDVRFSYDGRSWALDGVSLDIERGAFLCVLGGNGSGKSTFARHIDALLLPDEGHVEVLGLDTADADALYEIRSNAGLVFQNPDDQIVAAVVEDDVAFGPENLGVPTEELRVRVGEALRRVGLQGFEKRETFALSGGQKQRVAIAGTLAMEPQVIVLDEPASMLDPRGRADLMKLCRELNAAGMTVVLITHFMVEAAAADRVVVLDGGRVAMDGRPDEVLAQARRLRALALDIPFATSMSLALQDCGVPVGVCVAEEALVQQVKALAGEGVTEGGDLARGALAGERASAEPSGAPALIAFEDVAFSYASKQARRQAAKRARAEAASCSARAEATVERAQDEANACTAWAEAEDCSTRAEAGWGGKADEVWALKGATFALHEGDFLGVAGHTGSGKSTLAQLAAGLIAPTRGKVLLREHNLATRGADEARRTVGMVFQYPEHQLFASTVFDDVAFGPRNLGLAADEVELRVRASLELVHLDVDAIGEKSPFELSGGQQRRVALAGVLAMEPAVLILDEPTAGLDPRAHELFLTLIAELHETSNAATVIVSHNMDDLARLCNRVMLLNRGRIAAVGAPEVIFSDEQAIERIGLGVPHTVHLANRLGLAGAMRGIPSERELAECIAARWRTREAGER